MACVGMWAHQSSSFLKRSLQSVAPFLYEMVVLEATADATVATSNGLEEWQAPWLAHCWRFFSLGGSSGASGTIIASFKGKYIGCYFLFSMVVNHTVQYCWLLLVIDTTAFCITLAIIN